MYELRFSLRYFWYYNSARIDNVKVLYPENQTNYTQFSVNNNNIFYHHYRMVFDIY
ncbi:MAG: hypothetical protein ACI8RD_009900 [Bacillariaceae sp.]|jgi:hypothetical protein